MRAPRLLVLGLAIMVASGWQTVNPPLWVDANGAPDQRAKEALATISEAGLHGLDSASYLPTAGAMSGGPRFEDALTRGVTRYLRDLHQGRVDPLSLGLMVEQRSDTLDLTDALRRATRAGRLRALAEELAPQTPQYRSLQAALATYRTLAGNASSLQTLPAGRIGVRPGDPFAEAAALHARLVALGDIASGTPPPPDAALSPDLVEGLKAFQRRHGLTEDGILGKRTAAALQVPMATRRRQIELALERLRWLPRDRHGRLIIVNIPMFRLWAHEANSSPGASPLTMKVIVGWAARTRTPVFTAPLTSILFRPYWNVPLSIARGEIVPRIRRDPDYLEKNHLEIVSGESDHAGIVAPTSEALDQVAMGKLRIRQRPGPGNSLGLLKFDFPNPFSVYMHGTPAVQLFARDQRDFSHGCIRVEDPVALAHWVLDDPGWSMNAITAATNGTDSRPVNVTHPTRVWVFYTTAVALPEGATHFAVDLYGHDVRLDRALRRP